MGARGEGGALSWGAPNAGDPSAGAHQHLGRRLAAGTQRQVGPPARHVHAAREPQVHGSGTHDKTGRHCRVNDPNGKLNIPRDSGYWMRDDKGKVTRKFKHICWDGCMFPNAVMTQQETWNNILASMIQVRENHGWRE